MKIKVVRSHDDKTFVIEGSGDDTIISIKYKLMRLHGIQLNTQILSFHGKKLDDDRQLQFYRFKESDFILLSHPPSPRLRNIVITDTSCLICGETGHTRSECLQHPSNMKKHLKKDGEDKVLIDVSKIRSIFERLGKQLAKSVMRERDQWTQSINGNLEIFDRVIKMKPVTEHVSSQEAGTSTADFDDDDWGGLEEPLERIKEKEKEKREAKKQIKEEKKRETKKHH